MTHSAFGKILQLVDPDAEEGEVKATFEELATWEKNESSRKESDTGGKPTMEALLDEVSRTALCESRSAACSQLQLLCVHFTHPGAPSPATSSLTTMLSASGQNPLDNDGDSTE